MRTNVNKRAVVALIILAAVVAAGLAGLNQLGKNARANSFRDTFGVAPEGLDDLRQRETVQHNVREKLKQMARASSQADAAYIRALREQADATERRLHNAHGYDDGRPPTLDLRHPLQPDTRLADLAEQAAAAYASFNEVRERARSYGLETSKRELYLY